ncbi:hypothetical protein GCM10011613_08330 [Cellvibrio zantedeschiae]|uniref:DUF4136 domain-containing protein n=1 Tax=Cellvibrio zantedeschiae TaxID=1237077 RepID=A0ABQ3AUN2_9GAMM|nr:DUF4136 domain-containing protein [Cellvibrio zantedeschiae]GGY66680.1 hypothetical protein GCM10011613_08330 [Cellvibrio zantedeschiae]
MLKAGLFSLLVALMCLSGCATKPYVATDYEASYNFAALKSFAVKSAKQDTKENILISPFTLSHIHALVNGELAKRYQSVGESATPDFYVTYHVVMEEKLEPTAYDQMYGFGFWGRGYRYPSSMFYRPPLDGGIRVYNQGSLIIDMVDAKTQQPIWRGVSEKRLNKGLNPQKQREILTSAVLEVLAQFPPVK